MEKLDIGRNIDDIDISSIPNINSARSRMKEVLAMTREQEADVKQQSSRRKKKVGFELRPDPRSGDGAGGGADPSLAEYDAYIGA